MAKFYLYVALSSLSKFVRGRCPVVCVRLRLNMRVLKWPMPLGQSSTKVHPLVAMRFFTLMIAGEKQVWTMQQVRMFSRP